MNDTATVEGTVLSEDALLREYDGKIQALARRFTFSHDDLVQEGRIAFLGCIRRYQQNGAANTAQVWPYAYQRIVGAMLDCVTKEVARAAVEVACLDVEVAGQSGTCRPDVALEARELVGTLDAEEQTALLAHLTGQDERSIAKSLGVSNGKAHSILTAAKENIRERA